ncbi:MAG: SCO family protein [Dokdonella sp.]|uniref:SCO family protein n=1 Tax=Dokdonella sp. TaxID=2291710 RepID=UPI0025C71310|nr:SCO family protein [Dokdonella sp.]MBX3699416.1 SCO family protein [Dokdonella sp.]MCW5577294.1 SCO family protein [Dokdonella sp.]
MSSLLRTLLLDLFIVAAGGATLHAASDGLRAFTTESARRLAIREAPRALPALRLQADDGSFIDLRDYRGRWLLVDFIYTRCQSYCSVLGGDFAQLQDRLAQPLAQGRLHLLSISFDPQHDDPARLVAYRRRFADRGHGWSAARPVDAAELATLTQAFGIKVIADGQGGYVHNASIMLVDPQGRLVDVFDAGAAGVVAGAVQQWLLR